VFNQNFEIFGEKKKTTANGFEGARCNNNFVVVVVVAASAYKSTADAFRVGILARCARRVRPPLFNGHARRPVVGQWRARHRLAVTPSTLSSRLLCHINNNNNTIICRWVMWVVIPRSIRTMYVYRQ